MFAVIYSFEVKQGCDNTFIEGWEGMTKLIYKHCNSLGSRLHKESDEKYIAYAYWPSEEVWENSSENLPDGKAEKWRKLMYESCTAIETLHKLNTISDLLAKL